MKPMRFHFQQTLSIAGLMLAANSTHAQFVMTPVPGLPPAYNGSLAWGDYDNDGRLDFVLTGSLKLSLWHNTGNGFSNVTAILAPGMPGLHDSSVAWGDFDNDRRLDLLITGLTNVASAAVSQLWRNTGSGFTNVTTLGLPGVQASSVAWTDFDGDGKLDFLITGNTNGSGGGLVSQLWRNTGSGFTNVPIPDLPGVWLGSVAWGDYDNDGRPDFLLTGLTNGPPGGHVTQLWRNTGNGFTNIPLPGVRGVSNSSIGWADYNNDGLLDFLLQGQSGSSLVSELWHNTGHGFTNVPVVGLPGIAVGSVAWGDFDNDGWLDFLFTGLPDTGLEISQLWRNTGRGFTHVPVLELPGHFDNSLAWGDFDNDGKLDFLVAGISGIDIVSQLWRNTTAISNSPPAAPTELSANVLGDEVTLSWTPPADDFTPSAGLSYNVRIGSTPGGSDIVAAPALVDGKLLVPHMGTARNRSATFHRLKPGRAYYWSVQAVDSGFVGSPFAAEQQFSINPLAIAQVHYANGVFEFTFTATPGASFTAIATSNPNLPLSTWIELGTVSEVSPGYFHFTDSQSTNLPQRFYRVRSVEAHPRSFK